MKIICISGKARHGKDTIADMMKTRLSESSRVLVTHFGDLVKYICKTYFDWDGNKDERGRHLLQYVGTDVVRKHMPGFWVDFVGDVLMLFQENWDYVIIPDCRFPNEFEDLADRGFDTTLVRVERPGFVSDLTTEQLEHPSETALDNYPATFYIMNDGTLDELSNTVDLLLAQL